MQRRGTRYCRSAFVRDARCVNEALEQAFDATVVEVLGTALDSTGAIVVSVGDEFLTSRSACGEWTVGMLIEHIAVVTEKFSAYARGDTDEPRQQPLGSHRDVPRRYVEAASASKLAWARPVGDRVCRLPFGEFDRWTAAAINAFDVIVHGWDLARDVGAVCSVDDVAAELTLSIATLLATPTARQHGHYKAPQGADATTSTFAAALALTGRRPA
jgi:uncharacterized protein (TIGR03086 family)